jgi:hypothetical protein
MPARGHAPALLDVARQHAGLSEDDLWLRYLALGGRAGLERMGGFLAGTAEPGPLEYDVLAHALNERFTELDLESPVPYSDDAGDGFAE